MYLNGVARHLICGTCNGCFTASNPCIVSVNYIPPALCFSSFSKSKSRRVGARQDTCGLIVGHLQYLSTKPPGDSEHDQFPAPKKLNNTANNSVQDLLREKINNFNLIQKIADSSSVLKDVTAITQTRTSTGREGITETRTTTDSEGKKPEDWNDILNRWYKQYQDFIGITDMKNAQDRVTELSEVLLGTQSQRRELQAELEDLQQRLVKNHQQITKSEQYSQEHFTLFEEARVMNERLKIVRSEFAQCERLERDTFTQLSAAIRDCHERERMQAEQSKYWSIIASVVSAALASVITSVNNWVRIKEIKVHVSSTNKELLEGYRQMHQDVIGAISSLDTSSAATNTHKSTPVSTTAEERVKMRELGTSEVTKTVLPAPEVVIDSSFTGDVKEALKHHSDDFKQDLIQHITVMLEKEHQVIKDEVEKRLDAIVNRLMSEMEKADDRLQSLIRKTISDALAQIAVEGGGEGMEIEGVGPGEGAVGAVVDYGYRHIATAMAVGAGIGTLVTAFLLGSFGGAVA